MSESTDTPATPLLVETDLTLSVDGAQAEVESTGERLLVQFRSVPDLLDAFRKRPDSGGNALAAILDQTDLTVEVRARDRIVAVVGADARGGIVGRLLGVDPVEVRVAGAAGALGAEVLAAVDLVRGTLR